MKYAVIDTETTGVGKGKNGRIVQLSVAVFSNGRQVDRLNTYVNPRCRIPTEAYRIHHIGYKQVRNAPTIQQLKKRIQKRLKGCKVVVGHNVAFDLRMLKQNGVNIERGREARDTMALAREKYGKPLKLEKLAKKLNIKTGKTNFHSAVDDVRVTAACYQKLKKRR